MTGAGNRKKNFQAFRTAMGNKRRSLSSLRFDVETKLKVDLKQKITPKRVLSFQCTTRNFQKYSDPKIRFTYETAENGTRSMLPC
jgi:hypothetical protein